jgi:hypothetical protein
MRYNLFKEPMLMGPRCLMPTLTKSSMVACEEGEQPMAARLQY